MQPQYTCNLKRNIVIITFIFLVPFTLITSLTNLSSNPPLWWDEGWTLSVARNWVEHGHYGQLLSGEPRSAGLSASFPIVAPIALSFKLFGVGVWQARIVSVAYTFGILTLFTLLGKQLYSCKVAIITLVVLLLLSQSWQAHPVFWGRQALGEIPSLFYLLLGYFFLLSGLRGRRWHMALAAIFWGIALKSKLQVFPFFALSLLIPLLLSWVKRWRPTVFYLTIGLFGSLAIWWVFPWFQRILIGPSNIPKESFADLISITALVLVPSVRVAAVERVVAYGLPALFGLVYGIWKTRQWHHHARQDDAKGLVQLSLLTLTVSWYAWYVLLAIWWERYFFPPLFLSSIFMAALLSDLIGKYEIRSLLKPFHMLLGEETLNLRAIFRWIVTLVILVWMVAFSFRTVVDLIFRVTVPSKSSPAEVAEYINSQTPSDALIETFESELFFFLDRDYHYPPDKIQVTLQYPTYFGINRTVDYDPLNADPDYLVLGPYSEAIHKGIIYGPVIDSGNFRLVAAFPAYKVYERVR